MTRREMALQPQPHLHDGGYLQPDSHFQPEAAGGVGGHALLTSARLNAFSSCKETRDIMKANINSAGQLYRLHARSMASKISLIMIKMTWPLHCEPCNLATAAQPDVLVSHLYALIVSVRCFCCRQLDAINLCPLSRWVVCYIIRFVRSIQATCSSLDYHKEGSHHSLCVKQWSIS
jgi:hypothetical protein